MKIGHAIDYAFDILSSVGVGTFFGQRTCWSIVYDVAGMKIYFRTFENRSIRMIDANAFDFSSGSESWIMDVSEGLKGDVTGSFIEYSPDINKALIMEVFEIYRSNGFLTGLPEFAGHYLAGYPEASTRPVVDR